MLDQLRTWIEVNWFGVIGILVGIITTYIVYIWQHKAKHPLYAIRNLAFVVNAKEVFPNLSVHYRGHGEDLDNLSVAVVAIWNAGKATIDKNDITAAVPLKIVAAEGTKILGASVIQSNNSASNATCHYSKQSNTITISFDYLDYMNGMVIEVLHNRADANGISVEGKFKECGDIRRQNRVRYDSIHRAIQMILGVRTSRRRRREARLFMMLNTLFPLLLMLLFFLISQQVAFSVSAEDRDKIKISHRYTEQESDGIIVFKESTPAFIYIILSGASLISFIYSRKMRDPVPKALSRFDDYLQK